MDDNTLEAPEDWGLNDADHRAFLRLLKEGMDDPDLRLPDGLQEAFRQMNLLSDEVALRTVCHFVNRDWHRPATGETFDCSWRWISALLAKERNRIVASIQKSGDIFSLYGDREPEVYIDWYFSLSPVPDEELDPEFLKLAATHGWEPLP